MFWFKVGGFTAPLLAWFYFAYDSNLPLPADVALLVSAVGFMLGGLATSIFHELERWYEQLSNVHGSAAFATATQMWRFGLFKSRGVTLGHFTGRPIYFDKPGHLLTIAPTRSGKGTCAVIPNLLEYPGSTITVDIKGENHAISGRRRANFGKIYRFAPFETYSERFNPLDIICRDEDAWDDAALIADMLIVPSGSAKSVFFEAEAKALLTGVILYVATEMPYKHCNLCHVRHLITLGGDAFDAFLAKMSKADHPLVRRTAIAFAQKEPKLQSSIMAEAQSHTLIFDSERVARLTSCSDFTLNELKQKPTSLFLIIPPEHLSVYRPLLRLMLGLSVNAMTRTKVRPDDDVLFLVDEFPALGPMTPLQEGLAYLAGYGVKIWLFAQDLGQIDTVYGRSAARSIVANTNLQTFSNMDNETLEMISSMLGKATVRTHHKSKTRHSFMLPDYDNFNVSDGETGRPLLTPDEIRCLGNDRQLLFIQGLRPILAGKRPYYTQRRHRTLWDKWLG